jgi:5-methylcytosine-specific restriction protein A
MPAGFYEEGAVTRVLVNRYERDRAARAECIAHHGTTCIVCGFNFEQRYGELGRNFIHVHHVREISTLGPGYRVDPKTDLVPLCPNCHAMAHRKTPALTPAQLRRRLRPRVTGQRSAGAES